MYSLPGGIPSSYTLPSSRLALPTCPPAPLRPLQMDAKAVGPPILDHRLHDCVNVILSYQNGDGGWATYENKRSFEFLEVRGWLDRLST